MRKLLAPLVLVMLLWFPAVAYAADDTDSIATLVRLIARGVLDGQYLASAAVTLSLVTTLARLSWQLGGVGARVMLGVHAFAGSLAAALVSGAAPSWDVARTAITIGLTAAGGYSLLQPLARWLRPRVEVRVPQPLRAVLLAILRLVDTSPAPSPPASTRAATAPISGVALVFGLLLTSSCATARRAGATATRVMLDCTAPAVTRVVDEAGGLAKAAVLAAISGDGQPDRRALRDAAAGLRDEGLRCAFAAAVAALATPVPSSSDAPQALGLEVDGRALRAAGREIAALDWGVSSVLLPGGKL
jgi:hypothetical protein